MSEVRTKLIDLLITDAVNSHRTNDALREALVGQLVAKAADMSSDEILSAITKIGSINHLDNYQKLVNIISSVGGPQD